jgi:serine/threonine-protein kinase
VPDVVGKAYDLAVSDLQQRHLIPIRKDAYDDNMPTGSVIAVDPPVDQEVKRDTKVTVTVSRGKAPLTLPNLVGQNVNDAQQTLRGMGLVVQVEERDSNKPPGQVIEQNPPDGAGLEPGATVKLIVSKGPPQVLVPAVKGHPCQEAIAILQGAGLKPNVQGANPAGAVVEQNPAENTAVPPGTEVVIWCF